MQIKGKAGFKYDMGKSKITIKYKNGRLPKNLSEAFDNADENDLKILLTLMMASDESGELPEDFSLAEVLHISESEAAASLKFWRGAGLIGTAKTQRAQKKPEQTEHSAQTEQSVKEPTGRETRHRNGVVAPLEDYSSYGSAALATLLEKRTVTAELINEAQRVFGKMFNTYDTGIVVWLVDELGFDEESVLAMLGFAARLGKKSLKYVEKLALSFYDGGYVDFEAVAGRIRTLEESAEVIGQIKKLYGVGSRALTTSEKNMFEKWTQKLGYGIDVITRAYEITVDNTKEPAPKYTNAIIEKWYAEGLRSLEDIEKYEQARKSKADDGGVVKSYDVDDFFEAAFKRSLEDLK